MKLYSFIAVPLLALLGGCAYVSVRPQPLDIAGHVDMQKDEKMKGFRYYLPKPYVLVMPDEKTGKYTATALSLPDYQRAYYAQSHTFLAKQTFSIDLNNGLLQQAKTDADTTGVAGSVMDAAAATMAAAGEDSGNVSPVEQATARIQEFEKLLAALRALKPEADTEDQKRLEEGIQLLTDRLKNEYLLFGENQLFVDSGFRPELFEVVANSNGAVTLRRVGVHSQQ